MTQYDITLSNGSTLATLYPLEVNGPDNLSTPRRIVETKPTFNIVQIGSISPNGIVKVSGNKTGYFPPGVSFDITGSTSNDGNYTVASIAVPGSGSPGSLGSWYDSGQDETNIILTSTLPSAVGDGSIILNAFVLLSDLSYRFVNGFNFEVINSQSGSPNNDATYTVDTFGSYYSSLEDRTIIPVTVAIPFTTLPYGNIQYVNLDSNTSLKLPGKGSINYGESLIENLVHITENFAADVPPQSNPNIGTTPAGDPLVGQLWYNTTVGNEGLNVYNGSSWTSAGGTNFGTDALTFIDSEDSNNTIFITGSESNLPAPWPSGSPVTGEPGLVVWKSTDSPDNTPIFRVLSSDGEERLRVDHHSLSDTGVLSTTNNLHVLSSGRSTINGRLAIGDGIDPYSGSPLPPDAALFIRSDGKATMHITAATGQNVNQYIDVPSGQAGSIYFTVNSVDQADIRLADLGASTRLQLNGVASTPVTLGESGGNVGIRRYPDHPFHVEGATRFDDPVGINNAPPSGSPVWLEVTGDIQANSQFRGSAQSPSMPTYTFTGDTDTGIYHAASDTLGISAGGTSMLEVSTIGISVAGLVETTGANGGYELEDRVNGVSRGWNIYSTGNILRLFSNNGATDRVYFYDTGDMHLLSGGLFVTSNNTASTFTSTALNSNSLVKIINDAQTWQLGTRGADLNDAFVIRDETAGIDVLQIDKSSGQITAANLFLSTGSNSGFYMEDRTNGGSNSWTINADNNRLNFYSNGSSSVLFEMMESGVLTAKTTNYETLVVNDDDIPNKKYVDDAVGTPGSFVSKTGDTMTGSLTLDDSSLILNSTGSPAVTATTFNKDSSGSTEIEFHDDLLNVTSQDSTDILFKDSTTDRVRLVMTDAPSIFYSGAMIRRDAGTANFTLANGASVSKQTFFYRSSVDDTTRLYVNTGDFWIVADDNQHIRFKNSINNDVVDISTNATVDNSTITFKGTLIAGTANYETLVTSDDDIPNKKYVDDAIDDNNNVEFNSQTGTSYQLVLSDAGKMIRVDTASANTLTVPPNSTVAFDTGTQITIWQEGAGQTTLVEGSGVTIRTPETLKIEKQYAAVTLIKIATDEWMVVGQLEAI